jgi:hypothetical protein
VVFESVLIEFRSGEKIEITQKDLQKLSPIIPDPNDAVFKEISIGLSASRFDELLLAASNCSSTRELKQISIFHEADMYYSGPTEVLASWILDISNGRRQSDEDKLFAKQLTELVKKNFPFKIIYLPTYRRVEEDFRALGLDGLVGSHRLRQAQRSAPDQLINFGMSDVDERIRSISEEIRGASVRWYQTINAEMLNELAAGTSTPQSEIRAAFDRKEDLKLVLARLSSIVPKEKADLIISYVESGAIFKPQHSTLAYLLKNLVTIYDKTRQSDEQVKAFKQVVNKYLLDKQFVYDDIKCVLNVISRRTGYELDLDKLSSGEKQLVSVLSKVYLEREKDYAIFFDEPELSLSMEWQKRLIPDIMESGRCKFLLTTTHSPFMFGNPMENYVEALQVDFYQPIRDLI